METKQISVEHGQGSRPEWRRYHTRVSLLERGQGLILQSYASRSGTSSGLADLLFEIPGVESIEIDRYAVVIFKGELFTWEEIDPLVLEILGSFREEMPSVECPNL